MRKKNNPLRSLVLLAACIVAVSSYGQTGRVFSKAVKAMTRPAVSTRSIVAGGILQSAAAASSHLQTQKAKSTMATVGPIPNVQQTKDGREKLKSIAKKHIGPSKAEMEKLLERRKEVTAAVNKKRLEKIIKRFVSYAKINSQSTDTADMNAFPLNEGQRQMAAHIEQELLTISRGHGMTVKRSGSEYVYVKIPANIKRKVPSIMFMAHLDITPEAPGGDIRPIVHSNYQGGDIRLPSGLTLSPETPQGRHLKNCHGKTIITSDGTTLLGADDKTGCTVLVTLIENIVQNKKIEHGDLYFVFSQNEDIGRAADRFETGYIGADPDIVIDVDGDQPDKFSVENFTAAMRIYRFNGKDAHPGDGFANKYGDALTAASYFIGMLPPSKHPSASKDKQGYIHCYSVTHPTDSLGKEAADDYLVKVRLRYFDKAEGDTIRALLDNAAEKTASAYPFVKVEAQPEVVQYENVAYSMYPGLPELIQKSSRAAGLTMMPKSERGGTTSAMMAAKGLRGGPCIFSGQQAEHSVYEWTCAEDMLKMADVAMYIVLNTAKSNRK